MCKSLPVLHVELVAVGGSVGLQSENSILLAHSGTTTTNYQQLIHINLAPHW